MTEKCIRDDFGGSYHQGANGGLMLGQFAVTTPQFGELQVYLKHGEDPGAAFISEETGGKYGVTMAVMSRFNEPGQYEGWGYVNEDRGVAFRFLAQAREEVPGDWISIWSQGQHVAMPPRLQKKTKLADGRWVAFRARMRPSAQRDRKKMSATALFAVDVRHPGVLARLASEGRLNGQDHAELLAGLMGDLESEEVNLRDYVRRQWPQALTCIAEMQDLPEDLQALARAERTRLLSDLDVSNPPAADIRGESVLRRPMQRTEHEEAHPFHGAQRIDIEL